MILDERMILEPGTGERFLIPVGEEPSASAVALLEPWACVEASYAARERGTLLPGGRLLVVVEAGREIDGLATLVAQAAPASCTAIAADEGQWSAIEVALGPTAARGIRVDGLDVLAAGSFDDIVYFGADADRIEALEALLGPRGVIDIVLGGAAIGRPVSIDVGRIHYDLVRWVGTTGPSAADGYAAAPQSGELRDGDRVAVIGAAGPMGFMHTIRAAASGLSGLRLVAIDIDDARLAHLADVAAPLAAQHGVESAFINSRTAQPEPGFSYVAVMVPAPPLVIQALALRGTRGAREPVRRLRRGNARAPRPRRHPGQGRLPVRDERVRDPGHEGRARQARARRPRHERLGGRRHRHGGRRDALAAVEARTSGGNQGTRIDRMDTDRIVKLGISYVPEGREVFPELSVMENIQMGAYVRRDKKEIQKDMERILNYFPILRERKNQEAGYLSGGEQQMLAIGPALTSRPKLLMLDEPSLGMSPRLTREIFNIIRDINEKEKVTIFPGGAEPEYRPQLFPCLLMENGRIVRADRPEVLREDEDVKEFYLGIAKEESVKGYKRYRRKVRFR